MAVLAAAVSLLLLLLVTAYYGNRTYRIASVIALLGHIFVTLFIVPRVPYTWDIGAFHRIAIGIVSGELRTDSTTVDAFGTFQGLLYTMFPSEPATVGIFNGLFAVLIFLPISYLCSQLYPQLSEGKHGVMALVLFLPLPFYLLSLPMREALTILIFFSILAAVLFALQERRLVAVLPIIPLWGMLFLLRPELALILLLGSIAAAAVEGFRPAGVELSIPKLGVVLGGIGAIGFGLFAEILYSFERVNAELSYRARGGAVYLDGMQYHSWFDFLLALPARAMYFQFAPFPLHVESIFHLLAFTATPIIIILFISAARSLYECEYDETVAVLLVVVYLAGIAGYGSINSNFGTNVRHRIVFEFLLIIMAAPVIQRWELLVRKWLGVVPSQRREDNEKQRKAQELDGHVHRRRENTNQTEQYEQTE